MDYRLFRPQYTARDGGIRHSKTWHIEFPDHGGVRRRVMGYTHQRDTEQLAGKVMQLVRHRRNGEPLTVDQRKWLDTLGDKLRERLAELDLINTAGTEAVDRPLLLWLDNTSDEGPPGYRQERIARGTTDKSIRPVVQRVRDVLDACGFVLWRDLTSPSASGIVVVHLGKRREAGEIGGTTLNYTLRDLRSFSRWLAKRLGRDVPLQDLEDVDNAATDALTRRSLSAEEMLVLLPVVAKGPNRRGLSGDERAILYRFAFESGLRPGQIRALRVADFGLDADPPVVQTHARYVKRRREHLQILREPLAAELRDRFAKKLPNASAFRVPEPQHMAEMLRQDLAEARAAWLGAKGLTSKQREERRRSDFLAETNARGERAVFYSIRHGHGTALAAAGVPEKDIAESMHHASRATTKRYLHSRRPDLARAIAALPSIAAPVRTPRPRRATSG